jgi:phage baseplate assembly protein W
MPYKSIEITNSAVTVQQTIKKNQFYKGFSSLDSTTSNTKLYDFDLVKQDLLNHFKTKKGERVMNPGFGSIIWDLLMEPMTDAVREALSSDITRICNSDPRIVPTNIQLIEYENGYLLDLTLLMVGTDQSENMRLVFDQKVGLQVQ